MLKGKSLSAYLDHTTDPSLSKLLLHLAEGTKVLSHAIRNVGLLNLHGTTGETNIQGETVQKLDDFSNKILMDYCRLSDSCAGYLSEENDDIVTLHEGGEYIISLDPLDGSSNIDVAAPIGTIFAIHRRLSAAGPVEHRDFLQAGDLTVAAGYMVYGSSTVMVLSVGAGVQMFGLGSDDNHYYLTHADVKIPSNGRIYSLNQGNLGKFETVAQQYIEWCVTHDKETSRPYSLRYIGSMVGDMHRTFIKGGIFMYPAAKGETRGKLRLLYECIPMSYLTEQAGGSAIDGSKRILEVQPTELHERCAIIIGCRDMVEKYTEFAHSARLAPQQS